MRFELETAYPGVRLGHLVVDGANFSDVGDRVNLFFAERSPSPVLVERLMPEA